MEKISFNNPNGVLLNEAQTDHPCSSSHPDIIDVLLKYGQNPHGWPPLLWAVHEQDVEAVQMLLEHGLDPNVKGPTTAGGFWCEGRDPWITLITDGATPLWVTAGNGNAEIARLLIQSGANPYQMRKDDQWVEDRREVQSISRSAVWAALEGKNYDVLQVFADEGIDFNAPCYQGKSALQVAAERADKNALQIMLR